jgi:hypothetical protein
MEQTPKSAAPVSQLQAAAQVLAKSLTTPDRATPVHRRQVAQLAQDIQQSPGLQRQRDFAAVVNSSPRMLVQRQQLDGVFGAAPQEKTGAVMPIQSRAAPNKTGLPDGLKSGIESLSGMAMGNVKVHYNSSKPAQLQALAYAQGSDIHVGPGQERHLPHEAWHVVQQRQGRVRPTMQAMGAAINNDGRLESEADVMGMRASRLGTAQRMPDTGHKRGGESMYGSPIQLRLTPPAITAAANIAAGPANAPNRDTVATGPTNVSAYTVAINAAAATRAGALTAIQTEYRAIGAGLPGRFLSGPPLRNQCVANRPFAAHVYDVLVAAATIPAHAAAVPTAPQKQAHLNGLAPHPILAPANMELLRNDAAVPFNDPLEINVQAPYGAAAPLIARVDFTEGQKGYITRVQDNGGVDATIADRPNYAGEFPNPNHPLIAPNRAMGGLRTDGVSSFSNVHHTATNEDAATQIGRVGARGTREHLEGGLDAITKVIAEGGRFICVGALGTAVRNDSLFFAVNPTGGFRSVEFRELWKMWQNRFAGAYGVTNAAVVTFITNAVLPANVTQNAAAPAHTAYHYDLDNSAIW